MVPCVMPTGAMQTAPSVWITTQDMTAALTAPSVWFSQNIVTSSTCATTTTYISSANSSTCTTSATCSTYGGSVVVVVDEDVFAMNPAAYFELARQRGIMFHIRTAEQRARDEAAAEAARVEHERRRELRHQAEARSRELLLSHLTAEQRATFERNKWFVVRGGSGATYRINDAGPAGNIDVMAGDRVAARLCCHCRDPEIPRYDQYLAQAVALQWDEQRFLSLANRRAA